METSKSSGNTKRRPPRKRIYLYLLNDDHNSIEYVIRTLMAVLPLCNSLRAEQLALITNNNGECLLRDSLNSSIYIMYAQLQKLGLSADIRHSKTKY